MLTAMAGYAMAPAAFDPIGFTMVTLGTGLTSASANAINQVGLNFLVSKIHCGHFDSILNFFIHDNEQRTVNQTKKF